MLMFLSVSLSMWTSQKGEFTTTWFSPECQGKGGSAAPRLRHSSGLRQSPSLYQWAVSPHNADVEMM